LINKLKIAAVLAAVLAVTGCPRGGNDYSQGKQAEAVQDYDTALIHYSQALQTDPTNTEYKMKAMRLRFEAAQHHVESGEKLRASGQLQMALAEFQKATMIDPASAIAKQEAQNVLDALNTRQSANAQAAQVRTVAAAGSSPADPGVEPPSRALAGPPQLMPLSRNPISISMTNDVKMLYEAVAKQAGISVLFDPDYATRRVSVDLPNTTLEQALDVISLEGKAFWKPVTNNIIFVAPDQAQKRRDYEEAIVKTIYLSNTILPQDITELINVLRQLLDLRRLQQVNAQNAIVIRDTPDKVMLVEKIIADIDKAKPEVLIQFAVLQARRDRLRNLGINPGTTAALTFNPNATSTTTTSTGTSTSSSSTTSTANNTAGIALSQLRGLGTNDYSVTMPSATATALLTDSQTKIIDAPNIRIVDGQAAKLRIGDKVPVATGSFQAGVGVGTTGTAGGVINPLVNTQFQYQEVGVNVDVTPRIHLNDEVSMKLAVEVSSVSGTSSIGGINQPIISTNRVEHDVRLQDGEVNIIGGLIRTSQSKTANGWPGLSQIPILKYFVSAQNVEDVDSEILIVVIPHIIRKLNLTPENLRSIASGTDTNPAVRLDSDMLAPTLPQRPGAISAPGGSALAPPTPGVPVQASPTPGTATPGSQPPTGQPAARTAPGGPGGAPGMAQLRFDPPASALKVGETTVIGLMVQDAQDLYSLPVLVQYNPAVISVEDVRQGGFLAGGAIVQRVDKDRGQAIISATRMPNVPGISGSGTVFGIVVRGVAPGPSQISVLQVNARNSQQQPIALITSEATVAVAP
jgi:general secretion pathway protein D